MSKYIDIAEDVEQLVPEAFKTLAKKKYYKLTKIEDFRFGFVLSGDSVTGPLSIVEVIGKPGVKVINKNYGGGDFEMSYIRTSPIVKVVDVTDSSVTFHTEGGIYKLEEASNG
jgi:hypothetical protein